MIERRCHGVFKKLLKVARAVNRLGTLGNPEERERLEKTYRRLSGEEDTIDDRREVIRKRDPHVHDHTFYRDDDLVGGHTTVDQEGKKAHLGWSYGECPHCGHIMPIPLAANKVDTHAPDGPVGGLVRKCREIEHTCPKCKEKFHAKAV